MYFRRRNKIYAKQLFYLFVPMFLIGQVSFYFHLFSHEHARQHGIEHNEQLEQDLCHRSIFHASQNHHCSHQEHITRFQEHCNLLQLYFLGLGEFKQLTSIEKLTSANGVIFTLHLAFLGTPIQFNYTRGPPFA